MQRLKILHTFHLSSFIPRRFFYRKNLDYSRFVQFCKLSDRTENVGIQKEPDGDIIDLTASGLPDTLKKCLQINNFVEIAEKLSNRKDLLVSKYNVRLLAPITNPDKIICASANYQSYCKASKIHIPREPIIFCKFPSTIIGPNDTINIPSVSKQVDWEAELAVIIGKECKDIEVEDAENYIFGYTLAQDITARDWNCKYGGHLVLGKSMDTFCPMGPAIVSKDQLDVSQLKLKCSVNGEIKQDETTSDIIFKSEYLISYLSKLMTLLPGDVILTGTPQGIANHSDPPRFLKCGDILKTQLEEVGEMVNMVL